MQSNILNNYLNYSYFKQERGFQVFPKTLETETIRIKPEKIFYITKKTKKKIIRTRKNLWSRKEDELLISICKQSRRFKWMEIAKNFKNRTENECMLRYLRINPKLKKGKWTYKEDKKLYFSVKEFGYSWSLISKIFKNRNHKQLRSRFIYFFINNYHCNRETIKKIEEEYLNELVGNNPEEPEDSKLIYSKTDKYSESTDINLTKSDELSE